MLYLSGVCFVYNFMTSKTIVPNAVLGVLIGIACIILFFKEILIGLIDHHPDWKPESITDYILENFFELFEYILSFSATPFPSCELARSYWCMPV